MHVTRYLIISVAFAFFVMCPRLAGMCAAISKVKGLNPYLVAFLGTFISAPLIALMVFLTLNIGVWAAIIAAVITDLASAAFMNLLKPSYALEILIIALFIWVGVIVAQKLSKLLIP